MDYRTEILIDIDQVTPHTRHYVYGKERAMDYTVHDWVSFMDPEEEMWLVDATWMLSPWKCVFGQGCQGIDTHPAPEKHIGCCSFGAHFVDKEDRNATKERVKELTPDLWQNYGHKKPITKVDGEWVTSLNDEGDACVFFNRPGFPAGSGCAFHIAAEHYGEHYIDWKPEVCWQVPHYLDWITDDYGNVTNILRAWERRDWGDGGYDFGWWCTDTREAYVSETPVYIGCRDELIELIGEEQYRILSMILDSKWSRPIPPSTGVPVDLKGNLSEHFRNLGQ